MGQQTGDGPSAIPNLLIKWASWASDLNASLNSIGGQLSQKIDDYNKAPKDAQYIQKIDDQIGDDLVGYAAYNSVIDDWVGSVGKAFLHADQKDKGFPQHGRVGLVPGQTLDNELITMSEDDLAQLVGDDPTQQAEIAAKGAELAVQLTKAENAKDEGRIRAILSQLYAQGGAPLQGPGLKSAYSAAEQEFAYQFFKELGSDQTSKTLIAINHMGDNDGPLEDFDNALAAASQDPHWDPKFTRDLLDPTHWVPSSAAADELGQSSTAAIASGEQLQMLRYGTFSEDFLTQSADYFLFSGKVPDNANDKDLVVFNALDRNPNAAYDYLIGDYQGEQNDNTSRFEMLLMNSCVNSQIQGAMVNPGENTALGNLIADAGLSDNGHADNGNRFLQTIDSVANLYHDELPDDIRPGIERLRRHLFRVAEAHEAELVSVPASISPAEWTGPRSRRRMAPCSSASTAAMSAAVTRTASKSSPARA